MKKHRPRPKIGPILQKVRALANFVDYDLVVKRGSETKNRNRFGFGSSGSNPMTEMSRCHAKSRKPKRFFAFQDGFLMSRLDMLQHGVTIGNLWTSSSLAKPALQRIVHVRARIDTANGPVWAAPKNTERRRFMRNKKNQSLQGSGALGEPSECRTVNKRVRRWDVWADIGDFTPSIRKGQSPVVCFLVIRLINSLKAEGGGFTRTPALGEY